MGKVKIYPEAGATSDVEKQKLAAGSGINLETIHDDQQLIETIRSRPISIRDKIKLKLVFLARFQ